MSPLGVVLWATDEHLDQYGNLRETNLDLRVCLETEPLGDGPNNESACMLPAWELLSTPVLAASFRENALGAERLLGRLFG